jgi:hypothetical protein
MCGLCSPGPAALSRLLDYYLHAAPDGTTDGRNADIVACHAAAWAWFEDEHPVLVAIIQLAAAAGYATHAWQLAWTLMEYFRPLGLLLIPFGDAVEQCPLAMTFVPVLLGFSLDGHRPDTNARRRGTTPWWIRLSAAATMDSLAGRGTQPSSCLALSALTRTGTP